MPQASYHCATEEELRHKGWSVVSSAVFGCDGQEGNLKLKKTLSKFLLDLLTSLSWPEFGRGRSWMAPSDLRYDLKKVSSTEELKKNRKEKNKYRRNEKKDETERRSNGDIYLHKE